MNSTKALKARTKLTSDIFSFCTAAFCPMYISFNRTLTQWQNSLWNVTGYEFTIMSTTEEQCWLLLILLLHYCNTQWKWNQGKQVVKVICHKAASPSTSIFQRYCSIWPQHDMIPWGKYRSASETGSQSVQLFLQGTPVWPTKNHCDICSNRWQLALVCCDEALKYCVTN